MSRRHPVEGMPVADVVLLEDVWRIYASEGGGVTALAGVSLGISAGESVALVGPSGCGKSTTLNLISGVDRPDRGRVQVCGLDLGRAGERQRVQLRRRTVGMVFQAFHLIPHLSVEENVALPLALAGVVDHDRVRELVERACRGFLDEVLEDDGR